MPSKPPSGILGFGGRPPLYVAIIFVAIVIESLVLVLALSYLHPVRPIAENGYRPACNTEYGGSIPSWDSKI